MRVRDPIMRRTSWLPNSTEDFMQGEGRGEGQVISVKGWHWKSDKAKLKALREFAVRYGGDPHLRIFVVNKILRPAGVRQRDYPAQAAAILRFVQSNVYYTNEPDEQIQSPWFTLKVKTGDCDDSSVLLAAMAESIRLPWKFALAGKKRGKPYRWIEGTPGPAWGAEFAHIYVVLGWPPFKPQQWASAEPTVRGAPLGYDVIMHGVKRWGEAKPTPARHLLYGGGGQQASSPGHERSTMPELGSYGDAEADVRGKPHILFPALARGDIKGFLVKLPWDDILVGVVQGVVTALAIRYLLQKQGKK